ncbi:hypothetical protein AAFF_G00202900 [Aldrovandia affinis]|uniref:Uncharacterized protein n=1 Tax=Aldrovandia affinis TaxID=143900 RepID=A0AAD7WW02_9TELE|nr:hypothetical protein AAFF_G00202900 [Aldrovandia affinis]
MKAGSLALAKTSLMSKKHRREEDSPKPSYVINLQPPIPIQLVSRHRPGVSMGDRPGPCRSAEEAAHENGESRAIEPLTRVAGYAGRTAHVGTKSP